jgi:hypothetical protein
VLHRPVEPLPQQHEAVLLLQRQVGVGAGVDEQVRLRLVVVPQVLLQEPPVPLRHLVVHVVIRPVAVAVQRLAAAEAQPHAPLGAVEARVEHHLVVVAAQRDQPAGVEHLDEPVEHLARLQAAIDVVAQGDEAVLGPGGDHLEQRLQRRQAAVDIADR